MDEDDDLWFMPGPPIDEAPTDPPWALAERESLFDPRAWRKAEAVQGRGLAKAAAAFARLDARATAGFAKRLALAETSALLWAQGDWVSVEKIALYGLLRESSLKDAQMLSMADWAQRRLLGSALPDDLVTFLGRHRTEYDGLETLGRHPVGDEFDGLAMDWQAVRYVLKDLHPITQASALFTAWRKFGLSKPGATLEAGVAAMKLGAAEARALSFLPVASAGLIGQGGDTSERLQRWYQAVENACLKAEMQLDSLTRWKAHSTEAIASLSGRTPARLIDALLETPALSAAMVAETCGCDKATARRNLAAFAKRSLVREITGQGRYKVWVAEA